MRPVHWKFIRLNRPPPNGYEVAELPHESILPEFFDVHKNKLNVVVVHEPGDPLSAALLSTPR